MNPQLTPDISKRVADYFTVVGAGDDLNPIQFEDQPSGSIGKPTKMLYTGVITDRYPLEDRADVTFPEGVPLFCFPNGIEIRDYRPNPLFYSFVHTSEHGSHMMGCCLIFYEPLTPGQCKSLSRLIKESGEEYDISTLTSCFIPRCLCIISHWPFITSIKKFLCQLYRQSLTPSSIPIERHICNFIDDVPAPPAGLVDITYYLGDQAITFRCPPANHPNAWSGVPISPLFECLDPENVLLLLSAVLVERQIIFISSQYSLLTSCAEVITSLIYPLTWSHVYIPILPRSLLGVLNAPLPIMVGIHTSSLTYDDCCISEEAVQVFVDENRIEEGDRGPVPPLPERRGRKLLQLIRSAAPVFAARPADWHSSRLAHFDAAFEMAVRPEVADGSPTQGQLGQIGVQEVLLREGFLKFFVAILKNYRKYVIHGTDTDPYPIVKFRAAEFVAEHPSDWAALLSRLTQTQAFSQFIDERLPSVFQIIGRKRTHDIIFFDESIDAKMNRYMFRRRLVSTPFLSDESGRHCKTFVPPTPDTSGLPETDEPYIYPTFPSLNPPLFSTPRTLSLAALEQLSNRIGEAKAMSICTGTGGAIPVDADLSPECFEKIGPEVCTYLLFLATFSALAGRSYVQQAQSRPRSSTRERDRECDPSVALGVHSQQPSTRQILMEYSQRKYSGDETSEQALPNLNSIMSPKISFRSLPLNACNNSPSDPSFRNGTTLYRVGSNDRLQDSQEFVRRTCRSYSELPPLENADVPVAAQSSASAELTRGLCEDQEVDIDSIPLLQPKAMRSHAKQSVYLDDSSEINVTDNLLSVQKAIPESDGMRFISNFDRRISKILNAPPLIKLKQCGHIYGTCLDDRGKFNDKPETQRESADLAAARHGLETAFEVLHLMLECGADNVPSDDLVFRTLAGACADTRDHKRALHLLYAMLDEGIEPEQRVFEEVTRACQLALLSSSEVGDSAEAANSPSSVVLPVTVTQLRDFYRCLCDEYGGEGATGTGGTWNARDKGRARRIAHHTNDYTGNEKKASASGGSNGNGRLSLNLSVFSRAWNSVSSGASGDMQGLRRMSYTVTPEANSDAEESPGLSSSSSIKSLLPAAKPTQNKTRRHVPVTLPDCSTNTLSEDTPYGFSRQGTGRSSRLSTSSGSACCDDFADDSSHWGWPSLSVVVTVGRAAVHAASPALITQSSQALSTRADLPFYVRYPRDIQVLLGEFTLTTTYPGLHIDLFSPFGTACPNPQCKHPLALMELRKGWSAVSTKYTTRCPKCKREFVPRFTVHCEAPDWVGSEGKGSMLWCEWLSPWVLRKEVLSVAMQEGVETLLSPKFQQSQGAVVFWNLVVAFRLLGLPYAFLLCNSTSPLTLPAVFAVPLDDETNDSPHYRPIQSLQAMTTAW